MTIQDAILIAFAFVLILWGADALLTELAGDDQ